MTRPGWIPYSRTGAQADWRCPRFRYYAQDVYGCGLERDNLSLDVFLGTCIHAALARLVAGTDPAQVATDAAASVRATLHDHWNIPPLEPGQTPSADQTVILERTTWMEAAVHGMARVLLPRVTPGTLVGTELPCLYCHDADGRPSASGPFLYRGRPDLILDTPDGLVYVELKATSTRRVDWMLSWRTSVQVHATMRAIEDTLNRPVLHTIVQGVYKGHVEYGRFTSALVYGYQRPGSPPFTRPQTVYAWKPGFQRVPVWDLPGGAAAWVAHMPAELLAEQFPQTPPIAYDRPLAEAFFRQRALRESAIRALPAGPWTLPAAERQAVLDRLYPQTFAACRPAWGEPCPFFRLCHVSDADPEAHGYRRRSRDYDQAFQALLAERSGRTP